MKRLYSGYSASVLAQVPYTVILYSCFEMFDSMVFSPGLRYERNDEEWFVNKFMHRFGSSTLSLLIA